MTFDEYQVAVERTAGTNILTARLGSFGMGLSGEAGEVTDYLKKVLYHNHPLDRQKMFEELGDVLWYVAALATTCDLSLAEIAEFNIAKLKKRYPNGFEPEKSIHREETR